MTQISASRIEIRSLDELHEHEAEIVRRISELPNGGHLFLVHPFALLADVGVVLSEGVRHELVEREPELAAASVGAYRALRGLSSPEPKFRVHLHGLFPRDER